MAEPVTREEVLVIVDNAEQRLRSEIQELRTDHGQEITQLREQGAQHTRELRSVSTNLDVLGLELRQFRAETSRDIRSLSTTLDGFIRHTTAELGEMKAMMRRDQRENLSTFVDLLSRVDTAEEDIRELKTRQAP